MKKRSKLDTSPREQAESQALAETVARYKARREAVGRDLFPAYDLALVAQIAAQISGEYRNPKEAAKQALQILDACSQELSARAQKREAIAKAGAPHVAVFQCDFRDGIRDITEQKRSERAEEYFRKFLVSEVGKETAAEQLARLKRDGFTIDEIKIYGSGYSEYRQRRRKRS